MRAHAALFEGADSLKIGGAPVPAGWPGRQIVKVVFRGMVNEITRAEAGKERLAGFDILRGVVTLAVFTLHCFLAIPQNIWFQTEGVTWRIVYVGNCLLECFFAMSGFLIGGALLEYKEFTRSAVYNYAVDRATRILPAYYAIFVFLTLVYFLFFDSHKILYAYIVFLQCYTSDLYFIGVAWTLSIEVFSYALLPVVIYLFRFKIKIFKNEYMNVIFFGILLILAETAARYLVVLYLPGTPMDDGIRKQLHLRLDALFYGLIVACLKKICEDWYARLASWKVCCVALGGMLCMAEWQYGDFFIRNMPGERHREWHALVDYTVSGVLAAAVLPFCSKIRMGDIRSVLVRHVCDFLVHVARISYSFYLVHLLLLNAVCRFYAETAFESRLANHVYYCFLMIAYCLACFFLSEKMFNLVEKPGMALRKKLKIVC